MRQPSRMQIAHASFALLIATLAACAGASPAPGGSDADALTTGDELPSTGPAIDAPGSFTDLNGVMWFYTTEDRVRFRDLTARLDDLRARGIRVLGIYSPYDGDPDKWRGCAPLDFYRTSPVSGTLEDFEELVRSAHARGMKVVAYFVNVYIDRRSAFFRAAEAQYGAGDRTSREVSAFRWSDTPDAPLPDPAPGPTCEEAEDEEEAAACTRWRYSETAGAYYYSLWGEAGFDFDRPGARREVERITKHWLDTGLDGFMFDAISAHPKLAPFTVEIPKSYTRNDKWLTFESTAGEEADRLDAFGLTSWFNLGDDDEENDYSYVARGGDGADDLERAFAIADAARARGKTTVAWSVLETRYANEPLMRPQEAALLAGGGMLYGVAEEKQHAAWPEDLRAAWDKVMITVADNAALAPSASRRRLRTPGGDRKAYAMTRTSKDGSQTALLVYNLKDAPASITIDLAGSGIGTSQTPRDLYAAKTMPPIGGASYTLSLPAWGFEILQVARAAQD